MPNEARTRLRVYVEVGGKRTFASAADWPGWCRSGKDEHAALEALAAYTQRYAAVAKLARAPLPAGAPAFDVVERLAGNATTDYGAPGIPARHESKPLTAPQEQRMRGLLEACWRYLDQVVAKAPPDLRKGPRGGGRDRDNMFDHVLGAEMEYAKRIGIRLKQPDGRDSAAVRAFRKAILVGIDNPAQGTRWPVPYAIRRTAWHALDHAWEIEDRSTP
ncbi:MAG TPA: hypothetical protein VKF16_04390 [Candidatus Dormibacteraeota bacterium]|nr:hypothetical protein [Candidatus Dormibacteraeota bacterium]